MNNSSHMIVVPGQVIDFPIYLKAVMAAVMPNEFSVTLGRLYWSLESGAMHDPASRMTGTLFSMPLCYCQFPCIGSILPFSFLVAVYFFASDASEHSRSFTESTLAPWSTRLSEHMRNSSKPSKHRSLSSNGQGLILRVWSTVVAGIPCLLRRK